MMKRYSITIVTVLCLTVLLSSCSSDDEGGSNYPASISQTIQTEWYAPEAARYMSFEFMYVKGTVYQNLSDIPEIAETFSGSWTYSREGRVLDMNILYDKSLIGKTEPYQVLQCDENTLRLRHAKLSLPIDFYRIVESYEARIGDRIDIAYVKDHSDFSAATYTSSNANIADVDADGRITVKGGGLAFITVSSDAGSVVVRVDGGQRVDSYTAEVTETIDQVIARHGEPDLTAENEDGMNAVYMKPEQILDHAVMQLVYVYYPATRKLRWVEIIYKQETEKWFLYDEEYLKSNFYPYLNTEGFYAPNPNIKDNHYYIQVLRSGKLFGMFVFNRG